MTEPSTAPSTVNGLWARALMQEWVRGGVRHAVVCPGSRSTALALAAASEPGLKVWSVIDERTAGFFALGLALESGAAPLVLVTSGTAGAHLYPAVLEAELSRVPLLLLTADRPWELHGFGAAQTLPQARLFGEHVRGFYDVGLAEGTDAAFEHVRALASVALSKAMGPVRGPVHLNLPFREPLAPPAHPPALPALSERAREGRPQAVHLASAAGSHVGPVPSEVAQALREHERGVIVVGPRSAEDGLADAVAALSAATGYPVLAEAASQLRYVGTAQPGALLSSYDSFLRVEPLARSLRPEVILRFGGGLTSKLLGQWLDAAGALGVLVSEEGVLHDPQHRASHVLPGNATARARELASVVQRGHGAWAHAFAAAEETARQALDHALSADDRLTEPRIAREVVRALPEGAQLVLASSMPVRDVDGFASRAPGKVRVFSNRGANGIDGTLSTALGVAASSGKPTVVLVGDLAFLHDLGALLIAHRSRIPLTVVVVNNDGGGIFSFLPVASAVPEHFETLFGTPHGLSFAAAAAQFGAGYHAPRTASELAHTLARTLPSPTRGLDVIELRVDRQSNVSEHQALQRAVAAALGGK